MSIPEIPRRTTDAELVEQARRGSVEAVTELLDRHLPAAYLVAQGILREPADAEDVVQETCVACLERLDECVHPDRFASWLLQSVRNRARNWLRTRAVRSTEPLDWADGVHGGAPRLDPAERADLRDRLLDAIAELPEIQRQVLLLHDVEGYPHPLIAEVLHLSYDMARQHLSVARRKLRTRLGAAAQEYRHD